MGQENGKRGSSLSNQIPLAKRNSNLGMDQCPDAPHREGSRSWSEYSEGKSKKRESDNNATITVGSISLAPIK